MGILGLTLGWLLLATTLSYIIIWTKLNPIIKAIAILWMVWFSMVMYTIPSSFAGHPKMVKTLPDEAIIVSYKIIEPNNTDPGGMYFWILEKSEYKEKFEKFLPSTAFKEIGKIAPRAYGLAYDRGLHEQLEQATGEGKGKNGILMWKHLKEKQEKGNSGEILDDTGLKEEKGKFEIVNPADLLPSKD